MWHSAWHHHEERPEADTTFLLRNHTLSELSPYAGARGTRPKLLYDTFVLHSLLVVMSCRQSAAGSFRAQ